MSTEITIRLGFFFGIFFLVAICEILAPRRALTTSKASRWFANLVIIALNPLSVRLFFPILPAAMALLATERQWGLRFHPIEIIISMGIKLMMVAALGQPVLAVLIFEVALNAIAMFNHSNIHIPIGVDRVLRLFVVTPDMHRVHHSVIICETNSNYGFNLPWWERFFGTYKDQPAMRHTDMVIELSQFRDPQKLSLPRLLIMPFVGDPGRVPINRH
jgi:hypothetical protein